MTNTLPSENGAEPRPKRPGKESAVGKQKHKRTAIDIGLALITAIVDQEFLDRYKVRDPLNRSLKYCSPKAPSTSPRNPRCLCGTSPRSTSWCVRRAGCSPISAAARDLTAATSWPPTDYCTKPFWPTSIGPDRAPHASIGPTVFSPIDPRFSTWPTRNAPSLVAGAAANGGLRAAAELDRRHDAARRAAGNPDADSDAADL